MIVVRSRKPAWLIRLAPLAALGAVLTACSSDGGGPVPTPSTSSPLTGEEESDVPPAPHRVRTAANAPDAGDDGGSDGLDDEAARDAWQRAFFGGDPTLQYLRFKQRAAAAEVKKYQLGAAVRPFATSTWTNIGPFAGGNGPANDAVWCDSGKLTAVLTHPTNNQIVYIANAGGVFRSTNADVTASGDWTWTALTDNLPGSSALGSLSVGDVAMSPSDPNTLYLGLGSPESSPGVGFFTSSDGGNTWTASSPLGAVTGIFKIFPVSSTIVLAATNHGMWRSTDGAKTFTEVALGGVLAGNNYLSTYSIARFANGTLIASSWQGSSDTPAHVYYSSDQGATWTQSAFNGNPEPTVTDIMLAAGTTGSTTGYALASNGSLVIGGIFKTTDSGHTFTYVPPSGTAFDTGQGGYNMLVTVDPDNANNVWVGTQQNLYRSTDAGVTWANASNWQAHADYHVAAWSKTGTKTLYIGNDGGLSVMRDPLRATIPTTTDLTYIDNRRNRGVASDLIYNISSTSAPIVTDAHYRVSIGLQDNGERARMDSGSGLATSGLFDALLGGDGFGTLYHPYLANQLLASINGNLYRSTDDSSFMLTTPGTLLFGVPVVADPSDVTGNGVFTFNTDVLYRSHDFGQTFATVGNGGIDVNFARWGVAAATTDGNTLAVVGEGVQPAPGYVSSDGGATWTKMGALTSAMSARGVTFDPKNANIMYLTAVNLDASSHHVWKSTNKGASFTALDTTTNGLPYGLPLYGVKVDPIDSTILYVASELGMYRSTDGGATWSRFGTGFPIVRASDFWVSPDGTVLRASTWGRGVWEIPLGRTPNTMTATITSPSAPQTVSAGQTVSFAAQTTDSSSTATVQGMWFFGDGTTAVGTTASHAFANTTGSPVTYTVTFVGKDSSGANAGATQTVTVGAATDFTVGFVGCGTSMACAWTMPPGGSAQGSVAVSLTGTSSETVTLSTIGLPAGVSAVFTPATLSANGTATMTLTATSAAVPGSYKFSVQGDNGSATHAVGAILTIASTNPITNGGFESGDLTGWTPTGTTSVATTAHTGTYAARVGSTSPTTGDSSVATKFVAPSNGGTLSFWYSVTCPDSVSYDWATATLLDATTNTTTTILPKTCTNPGAWKQVTASLVAGHSYTLTLTNRDDGYAGDATYTLYDDVTIAPPPPPQTLTNGDFESGSLSPWTVTGTATIATVAHGGSHSALLGKAGSPTNGDSSITQTFTAPSTGGTLSFWYYETCKDTVQYDWATATLKDVTANTTATPLAKTCSNAGKWVQVSIALVAGHTYTLTITNHDDNYTGDETYTYVDDVVIQ